MNCIINQYRGCIWIWRLYLLLRLIAYKESASLNCLSDIYLVRKVELLASPPPFVRTSITRYRVFIRFIVLKLLRKNDFNLCPLENVFTVMKADLRVVSTC